MSSYKQCSNNFNSFKPIINSTQFPKPEKENRVNMYTQYLKKKDKLKKHKKILY